MCTPAISLGFTFFCVPQLYLWGSHSSAFPSYISGVHLLLRSPAISLGFTLFFCVPSYISGVHHSYSFPSYVSGVHHSFSSSSFTSYLSGVHHSSSFTSYISGVHHFGRGFCVCDHFVIQPLLIQINDNYGMNMGGEEILVTPHHEWHRCTVTSCGTTIISRVPDQNGVSLLCIMFEIHHSGWEPSIWTTTASSFWQSQFFFFCIPQLHLWGSQFLVRVLPM